MYIFGGSMGKSELRGPITGVALQEMELLKRIACHRDPVGEVKLFSSLRDNLVCKTR